MPTDIPPDKPQNLRAEDRGAEDKAATDEQTVVSPERANPETDATVVAPQADAGNLPEFTGRETLKLLGVGGMAQVYLARDKTLDRELAIKVMASDMLNDTEFHERFLDEARIVAGFSHPNIVTIYGLSLIHI